MALHTAHHDVFAIADFLDLGCLKSEVVKEVRDYVECLAECFLMKWEDSEGKDLVTVVENSECYRFLKLMIQGAKQCYSRDGGKRLWGKLRKTYLEFFDKPGYRHCYGRTIVRDLVKDLPAKMMADISGAMSQKKMG